jgi:hypothetical protein
MSAFGGIADIELTVALSIFAPAEPELLGGGNSDVRLSFSLSLSLEALIQRIWARSQDAMTGI